VQELGSKLLGDNPPTIQAAAPPPTIPDTDVSTGVNQGGPRPGTQFSVRARSQSQTTPVNNHLRGSPPEGEGSAAPANTRSGGSYVQQPGRGGQPPSSPRSVRSTHEQSHLLQPKQDLPSSGSRSYEHHHPYIPLRQPFDQRGNANGLPYDQRGDVNGHVYQATRSPNHPATTLFSARSNGATARPPRELRLQETDRGDGHLVEDTKCDTNMSIDHPKMEDPGQDPSSYTLPSAHPYPVTPLPESPTVPVHDALHLRRYWEERATAFRLV